MLTLTRLVEMCECKQGCCDKKADTHYLETSLKDCINIILKEESHNANWNHGNNNVECILLLHIEFPFPLEEPLENPSNLFPEDNDSGENCCHVYYNAESNTSCFHFKQMLADLQMTTTADRKIFGKTLNDT